MPEGPSIVILKEEAAKFVGQVVRAVAGNSRQDIQRMAGRRVRAICSWGKHFLVAFDDFALRVHFMLFGRYRIDALKENASPRLSLRFDNGELNLYACSVRFIEGELDDAYDWSGDVMADAWDPAQARRKLKARPDMLAADALLEQDIFAGVGNIIKNEVLWRIRVHPESTVGALPPRKVGELVAQAREYSFDFLAWKKAFVLRKHYQVHTRSTCPRDGNKITWRKQLGEKRRRAFYCDACQVRYAEAGVGMPSAHAAASAAADARPAPRRAKKAARAAASGSPPTAPPVRTKARARPTAAEPGAKQALAARASAKKPAAKKAATKRGVAQQPVAQQPVSKKKPDANGAKKNPVAKGARNPAAKKTVAKNPIAKKAVAKRALATPTRAQRGAPKRPPAGGAPPLGPGDARKAASKRRARPAATGAPPPRARARAAAGTARSRR